MHRVKATDKIFDTRGNGVRVEFQAHPVVHFVKGVNESADVNLLEHEVAQLKNDGYEVEEINPKMATKPIPSEN